MGLGSILHHKYNKEPQNHILIIEATTVGLPNSISPSSRDETDSRESGGGGVGLVPFAGGLAVLVLFGFGLRVSLLGLGFGLTNLQSPIRQC